MVETSTEIKSLSKENLKGVEELIESFIELKRFPGAVLSIINFSNEILYEKAFGYTTYDSEKLPVDLDTIYDVASLSKVIATTSALMKLYEEGKFSLDDPVCKFIPEFAENGKERITIKNLLIHNAGLKPFSLFYKYLTDPKDIKAEIFKSAFENPPETKTVYSDYCFITLGEIVERLTGKSLSDYCKENFFGPLEMTSTMYKPPKEILKRVAPTEDDDYYRMRLVQGTVHDETADLLGGVAGHAGVFSTVKDIQKFLFMIINGGSYKNSKGEVITLFKPETIALFTKRVEGLPHSNSRALGWDTQPSDFSTSFGKKGSDGSFCHTGFTGTSIIVDQKRKVGIILLTNRVHPKRDSEGAKQILDTRSRIHDLVFDAVDNEAAKSK